MKNSLCKLLLIVLLIKNIRCGVTVRRDKRFLSTLFDGSEENATPQVIRVYKIPENYVKNLKFDLKNKTFVQVPRQFLERQNVTIKQPIPQEVPNNVPVFQPVLLKNQETPKNIPVFQAVPSNPQKVWKIVPAFQIKQNQEASQTVFIPQTASIRNQEASQTVSALQSAPLRNQEALQSQTVPQSTPSNPQEVLENLPVSQAAASFNQNFDERPLMNNPLYPQYLQIPNRPAQDFQKRPPQARHVIPQMQLGFTPITFSHELPRPLTFTPQQVDPQQPSDYFNYESQNEAGFQEKSWDFGFGAKKEDTKNLYHTQEFKDLLKEFNVTVDVKQLPDVDLIMSVLGTTTIDDTISTIKEIANTTEGMDLIKQFLDSEDSEHDGEVILSDVIPESTKILEVPNENENLKPITPIFLSQFPKVSVPATYIIPKKKEKSLWNPKTWFSYENNNLETTTTIAPEVIASKETDSFWDSFTGFFRSNESPEVTSNAPTVKKSPEIPPEIQAMFPGEEIRSVSYYIPKEYVNQVFLTKEPTSSSTEVPSTTTTTTTAPEDFDSDKSFFQNPILVYSDDSEFSQPLKTALDNPIYSNVPEEFNGSGLNRRNFDSVSEPQRISDFDFVAGKVHKANPDAMQALIKTFDANDKEDKNVVKMVSTLTLQKINEDEAIKNQKPQDKTTESETIPAKQEESVSSNQEESIEDQTEPFTTTVIP